MTKTLWDITTELERLSDTEDFNFSNYVLTGAIEDLSAYERKLSDAMSMLHMILDYSPDDQYFSVIRDCVIGFLNEGVDALHAKTEKYLDKYDNGLNPDHNWEDFFKDEK